MYRYALKTYKHHRRIIRIHLSDRVLKMLQKTPVDKGWVVPHRPPPSRLSSVVLHRPPSPSAVFRRPSSLPAFLYPKLSHIVGLVVLYNDGRPASSRTGADCLVPSRLVWGSWKSPRRARPGPWTVSNTAPTPNFPGVQHSRIMKRGRSDSQSLD